MKAETGYPLRSVYFYLTSSCNLRCGHCWIGPEYRPDGEPVAALDYDLFAHVVRQALAMGLRAVKLTGGEPLLHPEIGRILAFIRDSGLSLILETNGLPCTPGIAREIAGVGKVSVSVSLDSPENGTHDRIRGVEGAFRRALSGMRNLADAGIRPQVIMTVMRRNSDQLEAMVRLAESLGAGSMKFNVLQPALGAKGLHESGEALSVKEYIRLGALVETDLSATTALKLIYHHPPAFRPLSRIFPGKGGSGGGTCGILNIIGVLADGSYALCGIGQQVRDLVFGHSSTDMLSHVWQSNPVLGRLREGMPDRLEGVCGRCLMKGICLGSCLAQNYYGAGRLWAPFWYCAEAEREGFFPGSRLALPSKGTKG
jgi:SynChlorMet cassette radical SAM/SPASM protein ScmF